MENEYPATLGLGWAQSRVKAFQQKAGHPVGTEPIALRNPRLASRIAWMREEIDELETADDLVDQIDAVVDLMYFALGTLVEMGVDGEPYFDIVHRANMRKITEAGVKVRETDGKIQKPANWVTPESEMARTLTAAHSSFELLTAGPTDSVATCLAMVAAAAGLGHWDAAEFRSALPESVSQDGAMRLSASSIVSREGAPPLPFVDDFAPISEVDDANFSDVLQSALAVYPGVIVGIRLGQAYGAEDPRLRSAIVVSLSRDRALILDPGPDHLGIQSIRIDDLLAAVKSAADGVHRLAVR